jgi:hypothetical protein
MQFEAIIEEMIPWEFRTVSVPHKPKSLLPLGFRIVRKTEAIRVINVYPPHQWFNHDDILWRRSTAEKHMLSDDAMSKATEKGKLEVDGVVQLELAHDRFSFGEYDDSGTPRPLVGTQDLCLVFGMRFIYRPTSRDWVHYPWYSIVNKKPEKTLKDFMGFNDEDEYYESFVYNNELFDYKNHHDFGRILDVRIEELDSTGLYNVIINLHWKTTDKIKQN